jgi:hypothetical protein
MEKDMKRDMNKATCSSITALALTCGISMLTAACGGGGGGGTPATAAPATVVRQATLTLGQEVPAPTLPDEDAANPAGTASFTLYSTNKLRGSMALTGFTLSGTPQATAVTAAHIHDGNIGAAGSVVVGLVPDAAKLVWSVPPGTTLDDAKISRFKAGGYYVNAHTTTNGSGLIRGQLISFADNIQAIFNTSCAVSGCHVPGGLAPMSLQAGSSIGNLVNVNSVSSQPSGVRVIPNNSAGSVLLKRINGTSIPLMPLNGTPLSANDQNLIRIWIDMGANNN